MSWFSSLFHKTSFKYCLLILVLIVCSWPLFRPGMFKIHDYTHGARIAEMTLALQDGHFPVRWSQNFGYGYGMPLFQFYGPLPFYVGSFFYLLTNSLVGSVKFIFLLSNILTLVGGYLLGKKLFKNNWSAVITSLTLTLAPYRFLNLYVRGAVSELWGIMALPWICWSLVKIIKQEKWGWLGLTLSLSVLFLSHNISTLIFAPFIIGLIVLLIVDHHVRNNLNFATTYKTVIKVSFSGLLAVGLSAFYLFPAYLEKGLTQVEKFAKADYFDFRIHFLYFRQFFKPNWGFGGSEYGPDDPITFFLGYGQIVMIFFGIFLVLNILKKILIKKELFPKQLLLPLGLFFLLGLSIFLSSYKSIFIWESINILSFAQFPWRFLGISILLSALIAGWSINEYIICLKSRTKFNNNFGKFFLIFLILLTLYNLRFVKPQNQLNNYEEFYYTDSLKIRHEMSDVLHDYLPANFSVATHRIQDDIIDPLQKKFVYSLVPTEELISNQQEIDFQKISVILDNTHYKIIATNFEKPVQLKLALAYYPGWQAWTNQEPVPINLDNDGTILINIDAGERLTVLKLCSTQIRKISDLVSLLCILLVLGLTVFQNKNILKKFNANA